MPVRALLRSRGAGRGRKFSFVLNTNDQIKDVVGPDNLHPAIVGNKVFDVLPTTQDLVDFTRKQYLLLQLIWRGSTLEDAAQKSGYESLESAQTFLDTAKAKDYLQKRQLASIIAQETKNEDNWWVEIHQVRTGEKVLNKGQMVALQASGDRVAPKKVEQAEDKRKIVINFNFSPQKVQEAFRRQESIETEIVQEQSA